MDWNVPRLLPQLSAAPNVLTIPSVSPISRCFKTVVVGAKVRIPNEAPCFLFFFLFLIKASFALELSFPVRKMRSVL